MWYTVHRTSSAEPAAFIKLDLQCRRWCFCFEKGKFSIIQMENYFSKGFSHLKNVLEIESIISLDKRPVLPYNII